MYNQNAFFEAGRGSIYDSPPKSKPKNANKQFADSMKAGGGGRNLSGAGSTAMDKLREAQKKQTQKDSGSTYDEVPQVVGLGSPLSPAPMPEDKNRHPMDKINQAFNAMLVSVGLREPTPTENPYKPVAVYSSELFKAPSVETILQMPKVRDLSAPYNPDTRPTDVQDEGGLPKDTAMVAGDGITTPDVNRVSPTLPKQGLMSKPGTPQELKGIPRGLAMANADEPTAKYEIQSGDTLSEIADATGTTVEELAKLNNIKEVDLIEAGTDIDIPIRTMRDKAVVNKAKSMDELKPIKMSFVAADRTDPDAKFYNSFNQEAGSSPENFIVRLAGSESSGNPDAEITNEDGRRFVGLLQFGKARLTDYKKDTKTKFTQDEFKKDLELQGDVAIWHINDIDKTIDSVIENSAFKNRDGLRAVAHLGGKTGMKKFVRSNGEYNPKDELGTSLLDYYNKFSN